MKAGALRFATRLLALLAGLLPPALGLAQTYPDRPIRIVVPFGPGSGTDVGTRLIATHLNIALGVPVTVENRPGANGTIAATAVARAKPDGTTLLMGTNSTHGANPGLVKNLQYDPVADFSPVALVATFSSFLVVHPSIPVRTPAELVAYAKANPGKLTFAAGNTSSMMMGEMFRRGAGFEAERIPYSSNPQAVTDVIAGRVSMMFPDIASSVAHVKSGSLRALAAVTLGERSPLAPDLPTVSETILPDFKFVGWIGLFAPAGTPAPVTQRLSDEVAKVLAMPEVRQQLASTGAEAKPMAPAEFTPFVRGEVERLTKALKEIGIEPE